MQDRKRRGRLTFGWLEKLLRRAEKLGERREKEDTEKMRESLENDDVEMYISKKLCAYSPAVDRKVMQDWYWMRNQKWVLDIEGETYLAWRVWS